MSIAAPGSSLAYDLKSRASFANWTRITLRYCDQDPLGHVNNGALPMSLEQARVELVYPLLRKHAGPSLELVLARTVIDYAAEITYPGMIEVGSRISRIGTKSFDTAHGIFTAGSGRAVGTGECILVFFDTAARRSVEPPPALRTALAALMAAGGGRVGT
jgi:acyl-CoA thioester hydrolase